MEACCNLLIDQLSKSIDQRMLENMCAAYGTTDNVVLHNEPSDAVPWVHCGRVLVCVSFVYGHMCTKYDIPMNFTWIFVSVVDVPARSLPSI